MRYSVCLLTAILLVTLIGSVTASDNRPPEALNDTTTASIDQGIFLDVLANDSDPDGDTLSISDIGRAANGTVRVTSDGLVEYTPDDGFIGQDEFAYQIADGNSYDEALVVLWVVNRAPEANDDSAETTMGKAIEIVVLANDSDADGDPLTIELTGDPSHGSVSVENDVVSYTPDEGFLGSDTFTYKAVDEFGGEGEATVTIAVVSSIPTEGSTVPTEITLDQNYPNPFNPVTKFAFAIPHPGDARIIIFDALGKQVRDLRLGQVAAGRHQATWDSRNEAGQAVPSGVYVYQLTIGEDSLVRTMTLVR